MKQHWVIHILFYNSWLHPTTSALHQHTCTSPPHGDLQGSGWGEEAGLTFSSSYVAMCVWGQSIV